MPQSLGAWPDAPGPGPRDAVPPDSPELVRMHTAVAVGNLRSCAISEGRVFCWGERLGAIGEPWTQPRAVGGVEGASAIGLGDDHACVLAAGRVLCWGDGARGQLGEGLAASDTPRAVAGTEGTESLVVGRNAACARASGRWRCWGTLFPGVPVPDLGDAAVVALGSNHACGGWREASGLRIRCAGEPYALQLGAAVTARVDAPVDFTDGQSEPVADARLLAAGTAGTCVVRSEARQVYCRGEIAQRRGGGATWTLPGPVIDLSVGVGTVCSALADGAVWCWGANGAGELGDGTRSEAGNAPTERLFTPVRALVDDPTAAARVSSQHACARSVDGRSLWCWGANRRGQLGQGHLERVDAPVRVLPP